MRTPDLKFFFTLICILLLAGCGTGENKDTIRLSGDIALPEQGITPDVPILVAATSGIDRQNLESNPAQNIISIVTADPETLTFKMDLSGKNIIPGDNIYLIAFTDSNYTGGIPYPDAGGDYIGIYVSPDSISPGYIVLPGENTGLHIDINRKVYDFSAAVSGKITALESGHITMIAFSGPMPSSDFSQIDFANVIGYATADKTGAGPVSYKMDILPYGKPLPIDNLYVFALLDANNNGAADAGDKIGFFHVNESELSSPIALNAEGEVPGIDIDRFSYTIPSPSGYDLSIAGAFSIDPQYFNSDSPVFFALFATDTLNDIMDDPARSMKYFYMLPQGTFFFDCDLSKTDLLPGDKVMAVAFWDRDYAGGFPAPTKGDEVGLVQNKASYTFFLPLAFGKTIVPPQDFEFKLNKHVYDFSSQIDFALDMSKAGSFDAQKAEIIVVAIHVDGLSFTIKPVSGSFDFNIDMDYILALATLPATQSDYIGIGARTDPEQPRTLPVLTTLFDNIVVWEENNPPDPLIKGKDHGTTDEQTAYLIAILDKNGNGMLDDDDEFGYYSGKTVIVDQDNNTIDLPLIGEVVIPPELYGVFELPTPISRITKGENKENRLIGGTGPYWIKMNPGLVPLAGGG
ncbi:MAG: hypothetical protein GXP53_08375 [Deltaproteobacteria bacterium]|nr:hypothetical protein [Deltaproteobacteria bacterium]